MKKTLGIGLAVLLALAFTSCSVKQMNYAQRTVEVSGTGTVTIEADTATIRAAVVTRAKDVQEAASQNAEKMNAIQSALKENGIKAEDISTENFYVYQETKYNSKTQESVPGDYKVTNQIIVSVKDITKIGKTVDVCLKSGANSLSSITYGITNPETAEKQARTLAIKQAESNANLLAGASGAQLGRVLQIKETSRPLPVNNYMKAMAASDSAVEESFSNGQATTISNAKSVITVNVNAVYQLR
ncbi:MAG: SIMPL domain-containing protein [Treponema sp.]|nr:SIMPL domain-containing protein [Treponema sp.]